ncbi:MAG: DNA alkylation repair protein [Actinobacteria bacterium]|nr:DNA alkylation repair protein [Actinomycetota bacterium]
MNAPARFVSEALAALADPEKAASMQAYMKTDMPFYGVPKPERAPIARELKRRFPSANEAEYRRSVLSLWDLPHREEKYLAIGYAEAFKPFITFDQIDLYQQLVTEGAWWDFVDEVASHLVGRIVLNDRDRMRPVLEAWIDHPDMWLRRTAILSQLGHKAMTDWPMLSDFCMRRAHEKEFFIRKAIGWALREYARVEPDLVADFAKEHQKKLSGLSYREATKHL